MNIFLVELRTVAVLSMLTEEGAFSIVTSYLRLAAQGEFLQPGHDVSFFTLPVRTLLNRCTAPRMPFTWTINPYRGCEFACKYCYARYTHEYMELDGGEFEKSNDILYAGRELARREARRNGMRRRWLGLSLLKWTIGYGLGTRYFRVLWWVAAFVAIGVATLYLDHSIRPEPLTTESHTIPWMTAASIDALLPIVALDKTFSDKIPASLGFYAKAVFWILGVAGWVLGAFLAAGLAGLTQKPS